MKMSKEEREAYNAFKRHYGDRGVDAFRNQYQGTFKSRRDYAENFLVHTEGLPKHLVPYIDFDLYISSISMQDITFVDDGEFCVHVFHE